MELITNQIKWLLYKNLLLDIRSWKISTLRCILPLLGAIAILILVTSNLVKTRVTEGEITTLGDIPKCDETLLADGECVSLIYYIPSSSNVNETLVLDILQRMCDLNPTKLTLGVDVVKVNDLRVVGSFLNYLYNHVNYTYGAIEWTTVNSLTNTYEYTVYYNATEMKVYDIVGMSKEFFANNQMDNIETSIERAILSLKFDKNTADFYNIQLTNFPVVTNQNGYTVAWNLSIVIILCVTIFTSLVVLVNLVTEKDLGGRGQMKFSGLKDFSFWTCEILNQTTFSFIGVTIMVMLSWCIPAMKMFHECNLFVLFLIMYAFQFNANAFASLISTIISIRKTANILACIIFAIGLTVSFFFTLNDSNIYQFFGSTVWTLILSAVPWFSFTKAMLDVKLVTVGPIYTNSYEYCLDWRGNGSNYFSFGTLFQQLAITDGEECQYYDLGYIPDTFGTIMIMIIEGILFYLLSFYFDKVMPTDKYRASQSPVYFLQFKESEMRLNEENALFIEHLSKTYRKNFFSAAGTLALKPFILKCPTSSVLCLLGPNGAGKTTTISCLTGLTKPSEGDAYIYGLSIISQMDGIRRNMGVCPQFDLLWDDLTAWEHVRILNGFKTKEKRMSDEQLIERLGDVRLVDVKDMKSKAYSGGMKRRLSVMISTIGDPQILFLDEPTTGMDPDNRQYVWKLIKRLKHNRLVILTTHSMEEADHLGDVVGIMAKGKLRCYGKPLELKSRFGLGFRVTLTTSLDQVENLKSYVQQVLPGAQLRGENAGALVYNLPDCDPDESIIRFFQKLESSLIPGITDWGIQNTTLEDVYLTIARKVMGQDITFEGAQMFDRDERQMFRDSVERYESKLQSVQFEIDSLRQLLEKHGVDHSVVAPTKAKKEFMFTEDLAENRY